MKKISQNFFLIFFSLIIIFLVLEVFIRIVLGDSPRKKFDLDTRGQPIPFIEDEILGWKPTINLEDYVKEYRNNR